VALPGALPESLLAKGHAGGGAIIGFVDLAALDGHVGGDVGAARPAGQPAARRVPAGVRLLFALVPRALGPLLGHLGAHLRVQEAVQHSHAETLIKLIKT